MHFMPSQSSMWSLWCKIANELPLKGTKLLLLLWLTLKIEKLLKIMMTLLKIYLKSMVSVKWPREAENLRFTRSAGSWQDWVFLVGCARLFLCGDSVFLVACTWLLFMQESREESANRVLCNNLSFSTPKKRQPHDLGSITVSASAAYKGCMRSRLRNADVERWSPSQSWRSLGWSPAPATL